MRRAPLSEDDSLLPRRRAAAAAAAAPAASASLPDTVVQAGGRGNTKKADAEAYEPPVELMTGKRRRNTVDYHALNQQMFGGGMYESYAGEIDDGDFPDPGAKRPRAR